MISRHSLQLDTTRLSAMHARGPTSKGLLVLAHGAGAGFDHMHMNALSDALNLVGINTLRFNFPFMQAGKRRVDDTETCINTLALAIATARWLEPDAPIYLGGHSFGGRMATHYAAATKAVNPATVKALMLFSFPLHVSGKPGTRRAAHLSDIQQPMLFLSGTRDALAVPELLESVTGGLAGARLHWLETADHSYKILKRTRQSPEDVYTEVARVASTWIDDMLDDLLKMPGATSG